MPNPQFPPEVLQIVFDIRHTPVVFRDMVGAKFSSKKIMEYAEDHNITIQQKDADQLEKWLREAKGTAEDTFEVFKCLTGQCTCKRSDRDLPPIWAT